MNKKITNEQPQTEEEVLNYNTIKNRFKYHKLDIKYNEIFKEIIGDKEGLKVTINPLITLNKLSEILKPTL